MSYILIQRTTMRLFDLLSDARKYNLSVPTRVEQIIWQMFAMLNYLRDGLINEEEYLKMLKALV